MRLRQALTQFPAVKPHVVTAQIHDAEDDVIEVRLQANRLLVESDDCDGEVTLDPAATHNRPHMSLQPAPRPPFSAGAGGR
jgi:hypothetical protein